jgi:hypothetical protein
MPLTSTAGLPPGRVAQIRGESCSVFSAAAKLGRSIEWVNARCESGAFRGAWRLGPNGPWRIPLPIKCSAFY